MPQIRGYLSEKSTLKQRRRHRLVLHKGTKSNVDSTQHKVFNKMYLVFVKAKDLQRLPQHFLHYFFVAHIIHTYILHVRRYQKDFFSPKIPRFKVLVRTPMPQHDFLIPFQRRLVATMLMHRPHQRRYAGTLENVQSLMDSLRTSVLKLYEICW